MLPRGRGQRQPQAGRARRAVETVCSGEGVTYVSATPQTAFASTEKPAARRVFASERFHWLGSASLQTEMSRQCQLGFRDACWLSLHAPLTLMRLKKCGG